MTHFANITRKLSGEIVLKFYRPGQELAGMRVLEPHRKNHALTILRQAGRTARTSIYLSTFSADGGLNVPIERPAHWFWSTLA